MWASLIMMLYVHADAWKRLRVGGLPSYLVFILSIYPNASVQELYN